MKIIQRPDLQWSAKALAYYFINDPQPRTLADICQTLKISHGTAYDAVRVLMRVGVLFASIEQHPNFPSRLAARYELDPSYAIHLNEPESEPRKPAAYDEELDEFEAV